MMTDRESIVGMIERGGGVGMELLNLEKQFGIEFNAHQLQAVVNRSWGKTYLSHSIALRDILNPRRTFNADMINQYDEDVTNDQRKRQWIEGLKQFAYSVGYEVKYDRDMFTAEKM